MLIWTLHIQYPYQEALKKPFTNPGDGEGRSFVCKCFPRLYWTHHRELCAFRLFALNRNSPLSGHYPCSNYSVTTSSHGCIDEKGLSAFVKKRNLYIPQGFGLLRDLNCFFKVLTGRIMIVFTYRQMLWWGQEYIISNKCPRILTVFLPTWVPYDPQVRPPMLDLFIEMYQLDLLVLVYFKVQLKYILNLA